MKKTPLKTKTSLKSKSSLARTPIKKRRSKRKDKVAWNLARAIWRLRGRCEVPECGLTSDKAKMDGAHIFGVGAFPRLGSDLRNGFCLCYRHHNYFHDNSYEFNEFIETTWAKEYIPALRKKGHDREKVDWDERIKFLKDVKQAIESGEMSLEEARSYET